MVLSVFDYIFEAAPFVFGCKFAVAQFGFGCIPAVVQLGFGCTSVDALNFQGMGFDMVFAEGLGMIWKPIDFDTDFAGSNCSSLFLQVLSVVPILWS